MSNEAQRGELRSETIKVVLIALELLVITSIAYAACMVLLFRIQA